MRRSCRALALVALVGLLAAACGEKPAETPAGGGAKSVNFTACQVTDTGGIDDRSFNATSWKGMQDAEREFGVKVSHLDSKTNNDFAPNLQQYAQQKCGLIVTVGFLLGDATKVAAQANKDLKYAIVDFAYDPKDVPNNNILGLTFKTDEAAFLAGYAAAAVTKSKKLGTFGGIKLPTVTIFMDGFWAGMRYYNKQKGANVELIGWDPAKQTGSFTGDFSDQDKGKRVTETLLSQGADIILPVAGPVGLGAAAAVQAAGGDNAMIWVDTDGFVSAPQYKSLFLTSIEKHMDVAVKTAIKQTLDGQFQAGVYSGTLKDNGVGIAPFHDFDAKVPAEVKTELETIKQGIISGSISVKPADYQ